MSDFALNAALDAATLQRRAQARRAGSDAERRIRAALAADPTLTKDQLARVAPCSGSTASKYLRLIDQERSQERQQAALAEAPAPLMMPAIKRTTSPAVTILAVVVAIGLTWIVRGGRDG